MKPNTILRRYTTQLAILGSFAFAAQVACSDDPPAAGGGFAGSSAGTNSSAGTGAGGGAGGSGTAGSNAAAGTFSAAGTFATAGAAAGGTGAGGAAGTGGTPTAGASTGGGGSSAVFDPFCKGKTLEALPYTVNTGFIPSTWGPDAASIAEIKAGDQIMPAPAADYCKTDRVPGAVGICWMWQWTPAMTPAYSFVSYVRKFDAQYTHPEVCLADGAKYVSFYARGAEGGETITVSASESADVKLELTKDWAVYSIPLDGVTYNSFTSGFEKGFSWKVEATSKKALFWIDNIQVVKTLPSDPVDGAGGAGGAGG